jgi:hypothetical protein
MMELTMRTIICPSCREMNIIRDADDEDEDVPGTGRVAVCPRNIGIVPMRRRMAPVEADFYFLVFRWQDGSARSFL